VGTFSEQVWGDSVERHHGRGAAWVGLTLNALLVAFVIYMFVDAIHMTYYPQGDWLWF
jgi:hypothetical protein